MVPTSEHEGHPLSPEGCVAPRWEAGGWAGRKLLSPKPGGWGAEGSCPPAPPATPCPHVPSPASPVLSPPPRPLVAVGGEGQGLPSRHTRVPHSRTVTAPPSGEGAPPRAGLGRPWWSLPAHRPQAGPPGSGGGSATTQLSLTPDPTGELGGRWADAIRLTDLRGRILPSDNRPHEWRVRQRLRLTAGGQVP